MHQVLPQYTGTQHTANPAATNTNGLEPIGAHCHPSCVGGWRSPMFDVQTFCSAPQGTSLLKVARAGSIRATHMALPECSSGALHQSLQEKLVSAPCLSTSAFPRIPVIGTHSLSADPTKMQSFSCPTLLHTALRAYGHQCRSLVKADQGLPGRLGRNRCTCCRIEYSPHRRHGAPQPGVQQALGWGSVGAPWSTANYHSPLRDSVSAVVSDLSVAAVRLARFS